MARGSHLSSRRPMYRSTFPKALYLTAHLWSVPSPHSEEKLEEDDSFLSVGSETWDYEIVDTREDEFLAAVKNSQMATDCERIAED